MKYGPQIEIGFPKETKENNNRYNSEKKTEEELREQVKTVEAVLGTDAEDSSINFVPKSENDDIYNLSLEEIKNKYPKRYSIYLKLLRAEKNKQSIEETELEKMKDWIEVLNNLDKYIIDCDNEEKRILREYQVSIFEALRDFIEDGGRRGYIKLPTGVGKTVLFIEFIKAFNNRIIIVVPTRQLVQQTQDRIKQFAPDMETGLVYSAIKEYEKKVTIITYDSLMAGIKSGKINSDDYQVLVLDEAHKSLSPDRQAIIGNFQNDIIIGFTATPRYSEEKNVGKLLETEIYRLSIKEATERGLLTPFSCFTVETDVDLSEIKLKNDGEYDIQKLEKVINIKGRNKFAVELYQSEPYKDKSVLVFCLTIKHAEDVAKEFIDKGVSAMVITGKQYRKEQEKIIEKFKKGEIKVLLTVDLLAEGFDAQNASVCFNLAPTHSLIRAEQRAGRVLRKDDNNQNKHAYVVDFLDKEKREDSQPVIFSRIVEGLALDPEDNFRTYLKLTEVVKQTKAKSEQITLDLPDVEVKKTINKVLEVKAKSLAEIKMIKQAPESWKNIDQLSEELQISHNHIKRIILEIIKNISPEEYDVFFGYYLGKKAHYGTIHYNPDFVEKIKGMIAPKEWLTADQILEKLNEALKSRGEQMVSRKSLDTDIRGLIAKIEGSFSHSDQLRDCFKDLFKDHHYGYYFGPSDKSAQAYFNLQFLESAKYINNFYRKEVEQEWINYYSRSRKK